MNSYYVINVEDVETARSYAPTEGLPNQLFQVTYNSDNTKAIVQADWQSEDIELIGTKIGELQADGSAEQSVYDYMASKDWEVEQ